MLISGTLNIIADRCKAVCFRDDKVQGLDVGVRYIENEIEKDAFTRNATFERFHLAFTATMAKTLNKNAFIQSEIEEVLSNLRETFVGIKNGGAILDTIRKSILINRDKYQVINHFSKFYTKESIEVFIRVVYGYELIKYLCFLEGEQSNQVTVLPKAGNRKKEIEQEPTLFKDLFYNPKNAEPCLDILRALQPPAIDSLNNYIGKNKGIFPLWINILKTHSPKPLIKQFPDIVYKNALNAQIKGLEMTKDASEFRKTYKRLENSNIKLDIKALLSQFSQDGKLGK